MPVDENDTVGFFEEVLPWAVPDIVIQVVLATLVFGIGWYLSKLIVRLTGRTVARRIDRPSVTRTVLRGVRISVLIVTLAMIAGIFGFGGVEILLSVTVISAIIAIVLAPLVASLINGLFILADRPYEIGDMIEIVDEDHRGFVEDITIRYTKIFTLENTFIVIPNSEIHQRDVINYSAEDERTRVPVRFEVTYDSDIDVAQKEAKRAARNTPGVISGGPDIRIGSARYSAAPVCDVLEYGDDGISLQVRFWVMRPYKIVQAQSDVQSRIGRRFAEADVQFAYPRRHHVFDDTSGRAQVDIHRHHDAVRTEPQTNPSTHSSGHDEQ